VKDERKRRKKRSKVVWCVGFNSYLFSELISFSVALQARSASLLQLESGNRELQGESRWLRYCRSHDVDQANTNLTSSAKSIVLLRTGNTSRLNNAARLKKHFQGGKQALNLHSSKFAQKTRLKKSKNSFEDEG
jgi:hypothetical protein